MSQQANVADAIRRAVLLSTPDRETATEKLAEIANLIDDNTDCIYPHRNRQDANHDYTIQEFLNELVAPLPDPAGSTAKLISPVRSGGMAEAFTFAGPSRSLQAVAIFPG